MEFYYEIEITSRDKKYLEEVGWREENGQV